jgi:hypothetical protein
MSRTVTSPGSRRDHQKDLPEPVDVDGIVVIRGAAGDVAGAAAGRGGDRAGDSVVVRGLLVEQVQPHTRRGLDLQFDVAGNDPAEVDCDQSRHILAAGDVSGS